MKMHGLMDVKPHAFLTSALDGGEWSIPYHGHFMPREGAPVAHRLGGWVGPTSSLDTVAKTKNPFSPPARNIEYSVIFFYKLIKAAIKTDC
jgi:hypothetical protein